jgi:superfamily II DNA or RNA helicase
MPLEIVLGNIYSRIRGDLPETLQTALSERLSYQPKDVRYKIQALRRYRNVHWDGIVRLFWPDHGNSFLTGLLGEVLALLKQSGLGYALVDRRVRPPRNLPDLRFQALTDKPVRPYQSATVEVCLKASRGIIQAATASGKTYIVANLIGEVRSAPFLFLVTTKDLLVQSQAALASLLNAPIGMVGWGKVDIQDITVMTVQTAIRSLHRHDKKFRPTRYQFDEEDRWNDDTVSKSGQGAAIESLVREAKGVYVDECHHAAAETVKEVLLAATQAYWRYGGSATPTREDGAEKMLTALFGRNLVQISPSWLIRNDYLVRPHIFNVRLRAATPCPYRAYPNIYRHTIIENDTLHRLTAELMQWFESKKISCLTLVTQYEHGERLQALLPHVPFVRGDQGAVRKTVLQQLTSGEIRLAVATTLADEGLDIPCLGAVIIAGGGKSATRMYQRVGRVLRPFPGKKQATVVLFHHDAKYLDRHGRSVRHNLRKEKEFLLQESDPQRIVDDLERAWQKQL